MPRSLAIGDFSRATHLNIKTLAVITHVGAHNNVDLAYGSLAAYVTDHALGVEGPSASTT
jgi:effector-binding domain-containing protein